MISHCLVVDMLTAGLWVLLSAILINCSEFKLTKMPFNFDIIWPQTLLENVSP